MIIASNAYAHCTHIHGDYRPYLATKDFETVNNAPRQEINPTHWLNLHYRTVETLNSDNYVIINYKGTNLQKIYQAVPHGEYRGFWRLLGIHGVFFEHVGVRHGTTDYTTYFYRLKDWQIAILKQRTLVNDQHKLHRIIEIMDM